MPTGRPHAERTTCERPVGVDCHNFCETVRACWSVLPLKKAKYAVAAQLRPAESERKKPRFSRETPGLMV